MQRFMYALVLVGLATPAFAQEVELAWKFNKGDKFFQTMTTNTVQTMKIMGQEVKQQQDQEFTFSWLVKDVANNNIVLEQKIEAVKMTIKIGNNDIKYDSASKEAGDNPLSAFFKPLVNASFTLTLSPEMKVTKVEGREEFVRKLTEANPTMATLLKQILTEDQLKQMSEPAFAVVPGKTKKVKAGDTWGNESKLNMGPIGSYDAKYTYKYTGKEKRGDKDLHKIDMETKLTYKAPDATQASTLAFKIEGGSLEATSAKGSIWFDAEAGRVAESNMSVDLKGTLDISVAEQKAKVEMDQKQTTTTKTLDKNPAETPK